MEKLTGEEGELGEGKGDKVGGREGVGKGERQGKIKG